MVVLQTYVKGPATENLKCFMQNLRFRIFVVTVDPSHGAMDDTYQCHLAKLLIVGSCFKIRNGY